MTQPAGKLEFGRGDGELLRAFVKERSQAAFAEIVRRHAGMVLAVCQSVLGPGPDAEDAAQAAFLTLARKAGAFGAGAQLVGWLHTHPDKRSPTGTLCQSFCAVRPPGDVAVFWPRIVVGAIWPPVMP